MGWFDRWDVRAGITNDRQRKYEHRLLGIDLTIYALFVVGAIVALLAVLLR